MPQNNQSLPPAAVVVRIRVADFDTWLTAFDSHEDARRAAGILGHHINRAEEDPNDVSIYMAVADLDKAKAFSASDDLRERMQSAGGCQRPRDHVHDTGARGDRVGSQASGVHAPPLSG